MHCCKIQQGKESRHTLHFTIVLHKQEVEGEKKQVLVLYAEGCRARAEGKGPEAWALG